MDFVKAIIGGIIWLALAIILIKIIGIGGEH